MFARYKYIEFVSILWSPSPATKFYYRFQNKKHPERTVQGTVHGADLLTQWWCMSGIMQPQAFILLSKLAGATAAFGWVILDKAFMLKNDGSTWLKAHKICTKIQLNTSYWLMDQVPILPNFSSSSFAFLNTSLLHISDAQWNCMGPSHSPECYLYHSC